MAASTPHDLAMFVYGRLDHMPSRPPVNVLEELFQTLFLVSLKTEEGRSISCTVAYADPKNPDPDPPVRIRENRWRFTAFAAPMQFDVAELTKMALAADPAAAALAVYPDGKGTLKIWGLFDQQGGFQSFLNHEESGGYHPPGIIQVQILGVGHIVVTDGYAIIAELNTDTLVEQPIEVFDSTVLRKKLWCGFADSYMRVRDNTKKSVTRSQKCMSHTPINNGSIRSVEFYCEPDRLATEARCLLLMPTQASA